MNDWFDARLGHRRVLRALRSRALPTGPSWWLAIAACLFWLLVLQCATGLLLMASYSPSMASAWASVHFIDQASAGRFLRGVHHFAPHAMICLFGVHVARVLLAASFRAEGADLDHRIAADSAGDSLDGHREPACGQPDGHGADRGRGQHPRLDPARGAAATARPGGRRRDRQPDAHAPLFPARGVVALVGRRDSGGPPAASVSTQFRQRGRPARVRAAGDDVLALSERSELGLARGDLGGDLLPGLGPRRTVRRARGCKHSPLAPAGMVFSLDV